MINTATYELSKYLDGIIRPWLNSPHAVESSFKFIERIKDMNVQEGAVMVSFYVKNLFTNIPLSDTVNIIIEELYDIRNANLPFPKSVCKKLLNIANEGFFV